MGPWRSPSGVSAMVVTLPALSSTTFSADSSATARRTPAPTKQARVHPSNVMAAAASAAAGRNRSPVSDNCPTTSPNSARSSRWPTHCPARTMLLNELVMARPRSFTASSSTRATARSGCCRHSCAIVPCWLQVTTRCRMSRLRSSACCSKRHALGTLARAGKRNPEILSSGAMELLEFGQQRRTGNRPHVAAPAAAKQRSQRPAGIVRRARAHQIDTRGGSAAAADSGAAQHVIQFGAALLAALVGFAPGGGLLPDFAGRVLQPALGSFLLRQIQQRAQRVAQRRNLLATSLLQSNCVEK